MSLAKFGFIVFLITVVVASIVLTSRRNAGARDFAVPVIHTQAEAQDNLVRARDLSVDALKKDEDGVPLTDAEKDKVREAANIFDGLIAFDPSNYAYYFGGGKLRFALGDYQRTFNLMHQAIDLAPPPNSNPTVEVMATVAEAHYVNSECLIQLQQFTAALDAAKLACKIVPISATYLAAQASAEVQLKHEDKAAALLQQALKLDPKNRRALQLAKLLDVKVPKQG